MNKDEDIALDALESISEKELQPDDTTKESGNRQKLLASMVDEDDEKIDNHDHEALQTLLNEISIDGKWFKRQLGLFVILLIGIILYITNRYQAQQEMILEEKLRNELMDWKYRNMTRKSELTLRTRQSQLELQLKAIGDSTLFVSKTAPYTLNMEE